MSLQLWLPMTKDLTQQGLQTVSATNVGATLDNKGKLGKCYSFNGNGNYLLFNYGLPKTVNTWSYCCWAKLVNNSTTMCLYSQRTTTTDDQRTIFIVQGKVFYFDDGVRIQGSLNTSADLTQWNHYVFIRNGNSLKIYINGIETVSTTISSTPATVGSYTMIGASQNTNTTPSGNSLYGYLNDIRLYDHALSPKEIEILSRGLVCHYPLSDRSNQTPNNVATYPTFDTSSGHGGWNHWGNTGNLGHYSQNTNSQYIFRPGQTYSHCFSDESTATAPYLLYQSPSFSGGYRSLCAIIKEENGAEIKESIVYPVWNAAVSGSIPSGKWTSITSLGNGFYLGKVEGFQQDGSNNLVGIYINAGYKVYVSEFYIENDRTVCSDFFYPSTTVYDTSGFKNNGETYAYDTTGSIECSSDTARYSLSTFINSANVTNNTTGIRYIYGNCELTTPQYLTVTFWCKPIAGYGGTGYAYNGIFALTNNDIGTGAATDYNTAPMHNRDADIDMCTSTNVHRILVFTPTTNEWHHYAVVYDGRYGRAYKDGVQTATLDMGSNLSLSSFKAAVIGYSHAGGVYRKVQAYYSDFRIYATALSAEQVAELYNTAVSLANNGALMGYELVEV